MTGRPSVIRYSGTIRPLHRLWELAERLGLVVELAPAPAPDVHVLVHDHLLADGAARLHQLLTDWWAEFAHLPELVLVVLDGPGAEPGGGFGRYGRE